MSEDKTQKVLEAIATGSHSPRDLEVRPPAEVTPREARIAVQTLLDDGRVVLNDRLKLQKATARVYSDNRL